MLNYAEPAAKASEEDDEERRVAPRIKTLKRGKVMFNNMSSTFDCIVRNISATGALLTLDEQAHLPREFDIRIGEEKTMRAARLVYRRGMLAGIHFRDSAGSDAPPPVLPKEEAVVFAEDDVTERSSLRRVVGEPLPKAIMAAVRWY